jgi:hypothetical protein
MYRRRPGFRPSQQKRPQLSVGLGKAHFYQFDIQHIFVCTFWRHTLQILLIVTAPKFIFKLTLGLSLFSVLQFGLGVLASTARGDADRLTAARRIQACSFTAQSHKTLLSRVTLPHLPSASNFSTKFLCVFLSSPLHFISPISRYFLHFSLKNVENQFFFKTQHVNIDIVGPDRGLREQIRILWRVNQGYRN